LVLTLPKSVRIMRSNVKERKEKKRQCISYKPSEEARVPGDKEGGNVCVLCNLGFCNTFENSVIDIVLHVVAIKKLLRQTYLHGCHCCHSLCRNSCSPTIFIKINRIMRVVA
jgi:hypothetical protein